MTGPVYLEDLVLDAPFACGRFALTRDEIVSFAQRFDPQPFHVDQKLAETSYFGTLVASGLHTQAAAIALLVRELSDLNVVAGGALHEARFLVPVYPETGYEVSARWVRLRPSASNPTRGMAMVAGEVRDPAGAMVATFGVTYLVARRP